MKGIIKKQIIEYFIFLIFSVVITASTFFITAKSSFSLGEIKGESIYYGWPSFFYQKTQVTGVENSANFIYKSFLFDIILWFVIVLAINTIIKLIFIAIKKIKLLLKVKGS